MTIRTPKLLREAKRLIAEMGLEGHWVEGTKHHQFFVGDRRVLVVSKGGDADINLTHTKALLQRRGRQGGVHAFGSQRHWRREEAFDLDAVRSTLRERCYYPAGALAR